MTYTDPLIYATLSRPELIAAIPTIPAGRELDGLIAKHTLCWESVPGPTMDYDGPIINGPILIPHGAPADRAFTMLPPRGIIPWYYFAYQWSTTDRDMIALFTHFDRIGVDYSLDRVDGVFLASVTEAAIATGDTRALAVARAALTWGCRSGGHHSRRS